MAGAYERVLGDQVGGREAQLAPALIAVHDLTAQLEGRAEEVRGLIDLAGRHQAADVAGGDDLAVHLQQRLHDGLEALVGRQQARVALRAVPEAEVLPDRHPHRAERLHQHVVDELARAALCEAWSKGITISSCTPSAAISSAFISRGVSSLGACWGATTAHGVRFEGEHAVRAFDHLAVAEVHAVEGADRDLALAALHARAGG